MRGGLTRRMLGASALLAVIVAGAFAGLLVAVGDLRESSRLAERSDEVMAAANRLERLVLDLQTGPRGFLIAGRESYLEPWQEARAVFPEEATRFQTLILNPGQKARASAIVESKIGRAHV